jgi:cob(I)alamin adenosyltransferase
MKGYVQVYTGDGKGKTTAALGLAMRAAGAGLKVFFTQFVKGQEYSEINALKRFSDLIVVKQYGRGCFIVNKPDKADVDAARKGFEDLTRVVTSGDYSVVILDEINIAIHYNLLSVDDILGLIKTRPEHVEIIITGRNADAKIIDAADLVTEMMEIKHYFKDGVAARVGIEK